MNWLGQYERSTIWGVVFGGTYVAVVNLPAVLQILVALNTGNVAYLILTWLACQRLKAPTLQAWAARPFPHLLQDRPWLDFWLMGGRTGLSFVLSASVSGFVAAVLCRQWNDSG